MNKRGRSRSASGNRTGIAAFLAGAAIAGCIWIAEHRSSGQPLPEPGQAVVSVETLGENPGRGAANPPAGPKGEAAPEPRSGQADGKAPADDAGGPKAGRQEETGAEAEGAGATGETGGSGGSAGTAVAAGREEAAQAEFLVKVYLSEEKRVEQVPLETYVLGVVAAEMPLDFQPAALEAQAMAARTYIIRRLWTKDRSGVPARYADVTDSVAHQVYKSVKQMEELKAAKPEQLTKLEEAVKRTRGKIITYDDQPIEALFFSSTNGYTEASEEVFGQALPYLRPVASPWDAKLAPGYEETVEMPLSSLYRKLGIKTQPAFARLSSSNLSLKIVDKAPGNRVRTAAVGTKTFSGVAIREKLGLRSTSFTWSAKKRTAVITTYGNGHGVGMSQWGAEGMARKGLTAEHIVEHYYTGAEVKEISEFLNDPDRRK
ncbi:stage II sporulation protein D [Cohnella algarum]|uniref:stage II sporulation protein D n=1 Tax=Cohnella algarum TaxID=2044859 RepID=UPI0019682246|nr:stage II sporulation protein D [Cohnella algarum]MBN2980706.1 stage II sporulation protein D [Cohnella algarum]